MMRATELLPLSPLAGSTWRWFAPGGCVVEQGDTFTVCVEGRLIGQYDAGLVRERNELLVLLARDPRQHRGHLAAAFGVSTEWIRRLRATASGDGLEALPGRGRRGRAARVDAALRERLERLFEQGMTARRAHHELRRVRGLGLSMVQLALTRWRAQRRGEAQSPPPPQSPPPSVAAASTSAAEPVSTPSLPDLVAAAQSESEASPVDVSDEAPVMEERSEREPRVTTRTVHSAVGVQHLGTWLVMALLRQVGLYERAAEAADGRTSDEALRTSLDAFVAALCIGEPSVEGVRRLGTPTAGVLLRSSDAPSASWTRRVLGCLAGDEGGSKLHRSMAEQYLAESAATASATPVYYVDNHLRPYTGKHTVRRGWRMQDKRVRPGTSDYYVHDEDGRPIFRVDVPSHDSLVAWLGPIAHTIREALGVHTRFVLAFDRAGAFAEHMAGLRDQILDCVTWERRPYPTLLPSHFDQSLELDDEPVAFCESRTNLGAGRGRVRRIALRLEDGKQINLLATGDLPAPELIRAIWHRWVQENGFKHGVERWGINQLDGRPVEHYPPDTVVPNPARRRLDRSLRIARVREGELRRKLAALAPEAAARARLEAALALALADQEELLARRPTTPTHAPLSQTELADKLVRHEGQYKTALDTIRIACANVESDFADLLAPHLPRPAEVKRALRTLFTAPGNVRARTDRIEVLLQPAGTTRERLAYAL